MIGKKVKVRFFKRVPVDPGMSPKEEQIHEEHVIHDSWVNSKSGEKYYLGADATGQAATFPARNIVAIISILTGLVFFLKFI